MIKPLLKLKAFSYLALLLLPVLSTAQEALWMRYPSISPDGSQIAFSYQDDIYVVASSGGNAKAITRHLAHDIMPVWSPDGQTLAFASNRFGNYDVFLYSFKTHQISRLTFHSANDFPYTISPDNKTVLFGSSRLDHPENQQFPSSRMPELYSISTDGQQLKQVLSIPAIDVKYNKEGTKLYFHNQKGYEDNWRKHHISSIARDLFEYDLVNKSFKQLTEFRGEDRNPVLAANGDHIYYLSEVSGSFNVHQMSLSNPLLAIAITQHKDHPVRFLSISNTNTLCYSYRGELYVKQEGGESNKLKINVFADEKDNTLNYKTFNSGVKEMAVSPNNKEIAFVIRGNIYCTSVEHGVTKQITNTPYEERNISFSKDGKTLWYAAEKGESWSLFKTKIQREDESLFCTATLLETSSVYETKRECFQPLLSPDETEIAFLEERTTIRVLNLEIKTVRTVLDSSYNYSYSDGDQWFQWSPDSKWLLVDFNDNQRWTGEVGIIEASGKKPLINLSNSGYSDGNGTFAMNGNLVIYKSDRYGMRSHGSWGSQGDILAVFLNSEAFEKFTKPKYEFIADEKEDEEAEEKKKKKKNDDKEVKDIEVETLDLESRRLRLTVHSAALGDVIINAKGEKMYYLAKFEKGYDLWKMDLKERKPKLLCKFDGTANNLQLSKDEKKVFLIADGLLFSVDLKSGAKDKIAFSAKTYLDENEERAYIFEHVWRQMKKKFYQPTMHGVDWEAYKKEYLRFLPHINNNYDFTEMLSEMLGELNASHTGSGYRPKIEGADATASLGIYIDYERVEKGVKVKKMLLFGPLYRTLGALKPNESLVLKAINGETIKSIAHYHNLLNHLEGKKIHLSYTINDGKEQYCDIRPISQAELAELRYKEWVQERMDMCEKLSDGKIAYVHVQGMNDASFRQVYSDLLGKYSGKEAVIVDTRFNGGGWLHDDLATLLSGQKYVDYVPRGQHIGSDPFGKWSKSSCVLVSEGNYSDAHAFPFVYQTLGIGKIVGMPVPGTMTAVWWETQMNPAIYFGIPQVGARDGSGDFLENKELQPDILIDNTYEKVLNGQDQQLEAAIVHLLQLLEK